MVCRDYVAMPHSDRALLFVLYKAFLHVFVSETDGSRMCFPELFRHFIPTEIHFSKSMFSANTLRFTKMLTEFLKISPFSEKYDSSSHYDVWPNVSYISIKENPLLLATLCIIHVCIR